MGLLRLVHGSPEKARLAVLVGEALRADAELLTLLHGRVAPEAVHRVLARAADLAGLRQAVRLVIGAALGRQHLHVPVALVVQEGTTALAPLCLIDREVGPVGGAQPLDLGVLVAEQPSLQKRVV